MICRLHVTDCGCRYAVCFVCIALPFQLLPFAVTFVCVLHAFTPRWLFALHRAPLFYCQLRLITFAFQHTTRWLFAGLRLITVFVAFAPHPVFVTGLRFCVRVCRTFVVHVDAFRSTVPHYRTRTLVLRLRSRLRDYVCLILLRLRLRFVGCVVICLFSFVLLWITQFRFAAVCTRLITRLIPVTTRSCSLIRVGCVHRVHAHGLPVA